MTIVEIIFAFIFGAVIGSFLNVLILRLPREEGIGGRSHCTHCGHNLSAWDLVPLFSYLSLRGRCRYCGKKISPRYFAIETLTGLFFTLLFLRFGLDRAFGLQEVLWFIRGAFVISVLIVVFMIDFEHFLILDKVVYPSTLILLLLNLVYDFASHQTFRSSLTVHALIASFGLFAFFGTLYYVSGGRWIGFGDVKFSFFLGLATPFPIILPNMFICFLLGSVVGLFLVAFRNRALASKVPFGVFLSISTMITLMYGEQIWHSYLNLIGWR